MRAARQALWVALIAGLVVAALLLAAWFAVRAAVRAGWLS